MFSVVIPAKNESENIARCIRSVFESTPSGVIVQVIVVDNGSTDDTIKIAENEGAEVHQKQDATVGGLRNFGVEKSNHSIIAFLDADCEAEHGWLTEGEKLIKDSSVGITGCFPKIPAKNSGWIERAMYLTKDKEVKQVNYIGSCNMILKKEVFYKAGGFDEDTLTGEDYIFCQKIRDLGLVVLSSPNVSVVHYGFPKSLRALYKRELWHGLGMVNLYRSGKLTLPLVWAHLNILILVLFLFSLSVGYFCLSALLVCLFFVLPFGATLHRVYGLKYCHNLIGLYVVFLIYTTARTNSLLNIIIQKFSKQLK